MIVSLIVPKLCLTKIIADMKKILLTGVAAAMFSFAAIAQQQDTDESNEFRQEDPAEQAVDTASNDFQQGVNELEQETEQAEDNLQQESNEFRQGVQETGDDIEREAEQAEDNLRQEGNEFREGARDARDDIEQGVERGAERMGQPGQETEQETEQTLDNMNRDFESTVEDENRQDNADQASADYNQAPELEVVEDKEGPNSEVVYEYEGEYFYVDRDKKEVVKKEKSELEDARHDVIINEGAEGDDNSRASDRESMDRSDADQDASSSNRDQTQPSPDQE